MTPMLDAFPVTEFWSPHHPDKIQLYSLATPNGVKVSIMLEECGLAYEVHRVPFGDDGAASPQFRALNPNGKIPAIIDPDGPDGTPFALWESGAILIYLADKTGKFLSASGAARYETIQWVMWQMSTVGPMFGQLGYFHKFAGRDLADKRPRDRYVVESRRALNVLNERLEGRAWIMGDEYTIADIATLGWVENLIGFYDAGNLVGFDEFKAVAGWLSRGLRRNAVQRGLKMPS